MLFPHTPLIRLLPLLCALALPVNGLIAEKTYEPRLRDADSVEIYKKTPQRELVINIYEAKDQAKAKSPAIIFYSGGGWVHADTAHFQRQARHYAAQGYTVFLPDYRVRNRDKTGVAECVEDATDAYRRVLDNAERLGVDPDQIILGGGSAGGHLALAVTLLHPELPIPDAFLVYNPVTQTTQGGYYTPGAYLDRSNITKVSLHDKVRGNLPPLLLQHGEADRIVPYDNSRHFAEAWAAQGNQVKLIGYPGADHGFFNKGVHHTQTLAETDRFLDALHNEQPDTSTTSAASALRPNIVFILADDMGYSDPGFLGGDIHTPNLDRLAAQGTVFTRFTNHSKCEPSRASLMTGVHFQRQTHDHVVRRFENVTTFAQLLSDSGYTTLISGKWHLPDSPIERGFDHFFGLLGGASNHFDPTARLRLADDLYLHRELMLDNEAYEVVDDDFYTTNAFTDHALAFLAKKPADKPFFLYLAYTAPHWPLQAPEETIKRYEDRYNEGWQKLQDARFKNMQANGWASKDWKLPDMPDSTPAWEDYAQQADAARSMAVHAAMVDQMDQQIGRVLDYLTETDQLDNTLVLFTSDNGAAGLIGPEKRFDRTPDIPAGPVESFRMLPEGFVHAVNSPYREQKLSQLSGGNTSPLIAFWPEHTTAGRIIREPVNILDFFPTFLEMAGVTYPDGITKLDGESFYPALVGEPVPERSPQFLRLVYVEADEHAVISAPWKLYRSDAQDWQLFNLEKDGTETTDLSKEEPSITQSLKKSYETFSSTLPHKK